MEEEQIKRESNDAAPMAGMLNTLLSNPELLQKIGSMVGALQNTATSATSTPSQTSNAVQAEEPKESAVKTTSIPSDGLASLLSDPSMMEKLPQIIAVMKPLMSAIPSPPPSKAEEKHQSPELCRDNLLCALKPFLSPERRDAVDSIMRISKLSAVFQQLK